MAVPVEEAVAALSTFSLEDNQPEIQGLAVMLLSGQSASKSSIEYEDVSAYRLSLSDDTKSINQLNILIQEGKEMVSVLYTYRSCVKALPQLPDSMKQSQADLYLETYQVLDLEISRLREIQRWQASTASKLAVDMQRFSRPDRRINGPTVTHMWSMIKLLDVLLQLDHLKNAKASIPNDFSWYKRTFTQVSTHWQDTDSMREELDDLQIFLSTRWAILSNIQAELFRVSNVEDILQLLILFCVESLESEAALLYSDRHNLLRVLPVLVVLVMSSEKEGDAVFKKLKVVRLLNIFKKDPVVPAFPDLHLAPASMLKELSTHFQRFSAQSRLLSIPSPHELPTKEASEYQRHYHVVNHIAGIRLEHDEYVLRFASAMNQLQLLKSVTAVDEDVNREIKSNVLEVLADGFQILSKWTGQVWEQCAWKFSRPCKEPPIESDRTTAVSDYEKVVRYNYSQEERKALVELTSYIKGIGKMMEEVDTFVSDSVWESIHYLVQDFVQNKLALMLRTSFKKKKDLGRILSDMRTIAADWMGNTVRFDTEQQGSKKGNDENAVSFHPRPVAPSAAQLHCLQFLMHELLSGVVLKKVDVPSNDMKQLEGFFNWMAIFPHILDYKATLAHVTDLGFLWFREFYLETSRVIQFPIECSLPWMLVEHVIESADTGSLESVLMAFDIYNDSAEHALHMLKQRFLYDEIEAEVDLCFDQLVYKLSEHMFAHFKSRSASKMLDPTFLAASDSCERFLVSPKRYDALLKMRRVELLGRSIDLAFLIGQRMNKIFRENLDFLLDRFESHDICSVMELHHLVEILKLTHELLCSHLVLDPFANIWEEVTESVSLASFSGRIASQVFTEIQNDFLPNFILCNTTQRFVRCTKAYQKQVQRPPVSHAKSSFLCGTQDLNMAHSALSQLYSKFFGLPHVSAIVKLVGPHSVPWLVRALLDLLSQKVTNALDPKITELRGYLPKAMALPPSDGSLAACLNILEEQLQWIINYDGKMELLQCLKEIGSLIFLISLFEIALKEVEIERFMQIAPWLGFAPTKDGAVARSLDENNNGPLANLLTQSSNAVVSHPACQNSSSFLSMVNYAKVLDAVYMHNIHNGSVLDYMLAFLNAVLDAVRTKWNSLSKTGLIEITTSREYHRLYSGVQFVYCGDPVDDSLTNQERFGDSVAWGGCTILYLLGQQFRFELLDFVYHVLNVSEIELVSTTQSTLAEKIKQTGPTYTQDVEIFLENAKKSRRLNNHVFSMLKARFPLEEKPACMIKQSGAVVPRIQYPCTSSAFDSLPTKS